MWNKGKNETVTNCHQLKLKAQDELGESVVTKQNNLNYKYMDKKVLETK